MIIYLNIVGCFFPINIQNYHWALVMVDFENQFIQYFDSCPNDGKLYVKCIEKYLKDKWSYLNPGVPFSDQYRFHLIPETSNIPVQYATGNYSGVYVCLNADRLARGISHTELNQRLIETNGRRYIQSCLCLQKIMM